MVNFGKMCQRKVKIVYKQERHFQNKRVAKKMGRDPLVRKSQT